MSQVQQSQEQIKEVPLPVLQPAHVQKILDIVNQMPTLYGRPVMNLIETFALQQYQDLQATTVAPQEIKEEPLQA